MRSYVVRAPVDQLQSKLNTLFKGMEDRRESCAGIQLIHDDDKRVLAVVLARREHGTGGGKGRDDGQA